MSVTNRLVNFGPLNRSDSPVNLGICAVKSCTGEEHIKRPGWDYYSIEYVLRGRGTVRVRSATYHPAAGDAFYLPRDREVEFYPDPADPWAKMHVHCRGALVESLLHLYGLKDRFYFPQCPIRAHLEKVLDAGANPHPYALSDAAAGLHRAIAAMADQLGEAAAPQYSPAVLRIKAFLEANVQRYVSVEEMAELVGRSVSQTIRLFRREMGLTPYEYHLRQKIEFAKALLQTQHYSVHEVAEELGFSSQYYFSRLFRGKVGLAPSFYRQRERSQ